MQRQNALPGPSEASATATDRSWPERGHIDNDGRHSDRLAVKSVMNEREAGKISSKEG